MIRAANIGRPRRTIRVEPLPKEKPALPKREAPEREAPKRKEREKVPAQEGGISW